MANMFKRGFKAVTDEQKRQEENKAKGSGLFRFFLKNDKDEADITFLTEQPVNYYEHTLKNARNGKEFYDNVPCIGDGCKHCANGDRPSFKSAWLIIDHREYEYEKDGKKQSASDQLRLLVYGTKIASQLDRKSSRYGLTDRMYTVVRLGKGTSTSYTFEHGDSYDEPLSEEEIKECMPEHIAKIYDGSDESLYKIIENQIEILVGGNADEEEDKPVNDELVNIADEEEETPPKKKGLRFKKKGSTENSVKPSVKTLLKKKR